jgi:hypothetical protein
MRLVTGTLPPAQRGRRSAAKRAAAIALAVAFGLLASGCGAGKFVPTPGDANSEQNLKRDCDNPQWKDQNLGLWYSLCRQSLRL